MQIPRFARDDKERGGWMRTYSADGNGDVTGMMRKRKIWQSQEF